MKLKWYGHSCFAMTFENGTVLITDPFDGSMQYPLCTAHADIALVSHDHFDHNHVSSLSGNPAVIKTAGAHFANGIKITCVPSFHDAERGAKRGENLISIIEADGLRIGHLGDLGHMPNEAQLQAIQNLDLMLIPIGGFFTIDTNQAIEIIRKANPRCAIAMHFKNAYCDFPISDESQFRVELNAEQLPNEIEITKTTPLPRAAIMTFKSAT